MFTKFFNNIKNLYKSRLKAIELYNQQLKETNKEIDYEDTLADDEDTQDLLNISKMLTNKQKTPVYIKFYNY